MNRYLTTTLPYVNADPHIGFALEILQADALARAWRLRGDRVFFSTGTDEHGQKIFQAAEKAGKPAQAYVDHYALEFKKLGAALDLSYDAFIRTTDPAHVAAAQEMWRRCEAAGDIYKKRYTGLYCVGCEAYKTEKEVADGHCLIHTNLALEEITEENYFFRLSAYQAYLEAYLAREDAIIPEWRRQEALNFVRSGLEDFSISRDTARLSWGIPVPGDDTQVMYVWFDALTNYLSTLGWPEDADGNFEVFWKDGATLQVAGKDQVRFQSVMWQAMLQSAGLPATDRVFYHGFINSGGAKMSKSLGNVISPYELTEKYGTDATRYLLLRHVHPMDDSDVTWDKLDEWYTANLVNGLGNLVARVMKLAEDNCSGPVPLEHERLDAAFLKTLDAFEFNGAIDYVFQIIAESDLLMTERAPFKKVKSEDEATRAEGREDIAFLVRSLAQVALHLTPIMPSTAEAIRVAVRENTKPENLFPRIA